MDPVEFFNKLKSQNKHTGVRIVNGENEYNSDPFSGINPFTYGEENEKSFNHVAHDKTSFSALDLNIENYSREDIFKLFGLKSGSRLTENIMKECKKTVLKTHPDKSQLDPKYFLFFSKAYKKVYAIYEFQNKNTNKTEDKTEYNDNTNNDILDKMFEKNKTLKNSKNFNEWFNQQFDKHKLEDPIESGYGDWLKSDEDIVFTPNVTKSNMAAEMEKRKKQVQSLTEYKGVTEYTAAAFGGSSLMEYNSNFSSGSLFSNEGMNYTDLRQAYAESVIPVTEEDYNKVQKFKSVGDYKRHRETANIVPLSKEEAMKQLYQENRNKDEESAALAFYYAQQEEKSKQKQENFWSGLKQLTN
jgi:hypothetical protein